MSEDDEETSESQIGMANNTANIRAVYIHITCPL
jgi:hypothetical protein